MAFFKSPLSSIFPDLALCAFWDSGTFLYCSPLVFQSWCPQILFPLWVCPLVLWACPPSSELVDISFFCPDILWDLSGEQQDCFSVIKPQFRRTSDPWVLYRGQNGYSWVNAKTTCSGAYGGVQIDMLEPRITKSRKKSISKCFTSHFAIVFELIW